VPRFSRGRPATLGLAPVSAKVAERAVAVQPTEERAAERFSLELAVVLPASAGVVRLRAERAPPEQIFSLGREEFSREAAPLAWRPLVDPAFFLFHPARTLLCLRRPPMTRAHSRKFACLSSVVPPLGKYP
jgi:hypothetical protein